MRSWLAVAVLAAASSMAPGQYTTSLAPDPVEPNKPLVLRLTRADAGVARPGDAIAWADASLTHFFARAIGTQENRDSVLSRGDDPSALEWPAPEPGVLVVGADLAAREEALTGAQLRALAGLNAKGLADLAPEGAIDVRRVECAKAILRTGGGGSEVATSKTGQTAEIRPLMDPTRLTLPSDMAVRLYAGGSGASGARVTALHLDSGTVARSDADAQGIANITLDRAGRWRLEFHAPAREGEAWLVRSATLTFDAGPVQEAGR